MSKNWRKQRFVLSMILSVFLLFTGCGRNSREIVPAKETGGSWTAEDTDSAKSAEEKQSEKADPKGYPSERKETAVSETEKPGSEDTAEKVQDIHNEKTIVVHVCGAVNSPGIYKLPEESRLWEAVEAAGGVRPDGAGDYLNMAAPVTDGEKVVVPYLADVEKPFGEPETPSSQTGNNVAGKNSIAGNGGGSTKDSGAASGLVDLNTATLEQLMTLPGIGESKAKAILEYREKTGPFTVPRDITNVPGIKEGSYEKLKDYITV